MVRSSKVIRERMWLMYSWYLRANKIKYQITIYQIILVESIITLTITVT